MEILADGIADSGKGGKKPFARFWRRWVGYVCKCMGKCRIRSEGTELTNRNSYRRKKRAVGREGGAECSGRGLVRLAQMGAGSAFVPVGGWGNAGSSKVANMCRLRSTQLCMVKKAGRKFQSDPVDFGVVGVEEDGDLLRDLDSEEDLNELDEESLEELEEEEANSGLYGDTGIDGKDRAFVGAELLPDEFLDIIDEGMGDLDPAEFEDEMDLIDISESDETEDADGQGSVENMDILALMPGAEFFRSNLMDKFVNDKRMGYVEPVEAGMDDEFTRVWAAAIHPETRFREVKNQYGRVGVNIGYNFADFTQQPGADVSDIRIEDESMIKAKKVFFATEVPAISISTSWDVENPGAQGHANYAHRTFIPMEVDTLVEKLRPRSDKNRKVHFRTIAAFYDGETEILTEGICEVAMYFASSRYASISIASALDNLFKELWKKFNFQFVDQDDFAAGDINLETADESMKNKRAGSALLKERIFREGRVLDGGILKVSSFLNHMVDVELMDACGEDLAERLRDTMPNKVLTVEATGLIPALAVGRRLRIPVVFARKSRPITISESFQTMYQSKTKGQINELIVSREYLNDGDRVLLIDDFLAGGSTVEALFKLATMAHARVVGLGVLIEKTKDKGRAFLSGYDVPVESLAKVSVLPDNSLSIEDD